MAKTQKTEALEEEKAETQAAAATEATSALFDMNVLAAKYRVPAWQQAALMRSMGWEAGKMVTVAEYLAALEGLQNRRLGGGRLA